MRLKSILLKPFASKISKDVCKWKKHPEVYQDKWFEYLMGKGKLTQFGKDHHFSEIRNYQDLKDRVPIRAYESYKPYIDQVLEGKIDVMWPGLPKYIVGTSGTTSGIKYIPLSKESIPFHIRSARDALFNYIHLSRNYSMLDGKMIFLTGSPILDTIGNGLPSGRLSGIINHEIPKYIQQNKLPSYNTNCIEDWDDKLTAIVEETIHADMTMISGIPPWVLMYYEKLLAKSGKHTIADLFPNMKLFIHGGVSYAPYENKMSQLLGTGIDSLETYPSTEGFIAYQDQLDNESLLLNTNAGMFFEFVPTEEIFSKNPTRLKLSEVEPNVSYAIIIHNNAGLWASNIGDTISFTSCNPYRLKVTGRIKHFLSAFGEHIIAKEVEDAIQAACQKMSVNIIDFTVAPQINPPDGGKALHEWFIEFDSIPTDLIRFENCLDVELQKRNFHYKELVKGQVIAPLRINPIQRHGFRMIMKSVGKLGGQNKIPHLMNDRSFASLCENYTIAKAY